MRGPRRQATTATRPSPTPCSPTRRAVTSRCRPGRPPWTPARSCRHRGRPISRASRGRMAGGIDLGAYEVAAPPPSPTPSLEGPITFAGDLTWLHADNGWGPPEVDRSNGERGAQRREPSADRRGSVRSRDRGARSLEDPHRARRKRVRPSSPTSDSMRRSATEDRVVVLNVWGDGGEARHERSPVRGPQDRPSPSRPTFRASRGWRCVVDEGGDGNAYRPTRIGAMPDSPASSPTQTWDGKTPSSARPWVGPDARWESRDTLGMTLIQ
jgi:hypothetical protein